MYVSVTDKAVLRIATTIANKNAASQLHLRIYIVGGGCSGFQYGFGLDENFDAESDTQIFVAENCSVITNNLCLSYLENSVVDFVEDIAGAKFTINNPSAEATCSCGSSFNLKDNPVS